MSSRSRAEMPVVDPAAIAPRPGSDYPPPLNGPVASRAVRDLAGAVGASDLAVNHVTLPAGAWSSQRHWHEGEDEVLVMVTGRATLVDDSGRHVLGSGDVAVFPAGDGNGHHLVNESDADCTFVVASRPEESPVHYPDARLRWSPNRGYEAE